MTALSESFSLMIICDIFSLPISTFLLFSQIGKPILDTRHQGRGQDIYEVRSFRRYTLTRMTAQDPLERTPQPSCTCPLEDWPTGCSVSTQTICMPLATNTYAIQPTHQLPSVRVHSL